VGCVILVVTVAIYHIEPNGFFAKVPALSLLPLGSAMLIPWFIGLRPIAIMKPVSRYISTRTYAIYLVHYPLTTIAFAASGDSAWGYVCAIALAIPIAEILHITIERPIMRLPPLTAPGMPANAALITAG